VDGDGLPDVVNIGYDSQLGANVLRLYKNITPAGASQPQFADPVTIGTLGTKVAGDVDGNGLPDYSVNAGATGAQLLGYVFTIRSDDGTISHPYYTTQQLGIEDLAVDTRRFHIQMDINGDGLQDIVYDCWNTSSQSMHLCYQMNTGVPGAHMFSGS